MPEVTLEWLQTNAKQLVKKHWSITNIPEIKLVTRQDQITVERKLDWDNYGGFYCSNIKTVVLNNENNKNYTLRSVKRILLHELVHWRLHTTGEDWLDRDERFARELIRVGLGKRHNKDEQAQLAAKLAWEDKKKESFEIIERIGSDVISTRMRHPRKDVDDFKKDLANTLIRMQNEREEDESIYPPDVADKMKEWYGYKIEPISSYGIELSAGNGYGNGSIGNRDDIIRLLEQLDVDDSIIEERLPEAATDEE